MAAILGSNRLRQWLESKCLQGYPRVADVEPHPQVDDIIKEIGIAKITNKQLRRFMNLKREGYDGMDPLEADVLWSYFGKSIQDSGRHR